MPQWLVSLQNEFVQAFIVDARWKYIVRGLGVTVEVTIFSLLLGVVLGVLIAVIRSSHDQTQPGWFRSPGGFFLSLGNLICKIYLTVIRGTPTTIQLLIMFFIFFGSSSNMVLAAVLSFGINSGAYVAEIVRGGIMSVDPGQMEAGRSLGMGYIPTMRFVIIPQAVKNILPALGNELITLLKETSVCGFIGLADITKGALIIQSRTYQAFFPLIMAACIYLVIVMLLTWLLGKLERRLRKSDRR